MNPKNNQQILIGGAIVLRENKGKKEYMVVKQKEDSDWEIPKVTVRRGESSVRAVIRMTAEQGGMSTRILEEVGRATGNNVVNGKAISQKYYYYLMVQKAGGADAIGFFDFQWLEFPQALKKITLKKEKEMLKTGRDVFKEWEKTHKKQQF
jgi:ADP-ribose pyrophosphatase YjhB (NUDIX family)